jgi:acyl-CoA thioesterase-1
MVWNLEPVYVSQFNKVYIRVATDMDLELMSFFLEDVAAKSNLISDDGVHPNRAGYKVIVENLTLYVVKIVDSVNL